MDDFSALPGGALVVGGSGGLGRAIATLLLERGARVAVTHRSHPVDIGVASYGLDLGETDEVARVVGHAAAEPRRPPHGRARRRAARADGPPLAGGSRGPGGAGWPWTRPASSPSPMPRCPSCARRAAR
ncbi:hypothetical protein [Nocardioides convexus]|uniref:hypothetical protein n=1 Tax=Nocardioides convexus TaxID=2712224 RepID=UPI002418328E|nr:hypothetical protein [Nocardioides convexus]